MHLCALNSDGTRCRRYDISSDKTTIRWNLQKEDVQRTTTILMSSAIIWLSIMFPYLLHWFLALLFLFFFLLILLNLKSNTKFIELFLNIIHFHNFVLVYNHVLIISSMRTVVGLSYRESTVLWLHRNNSSTMNIIPMLCWSKYHDACIIIEHLSKGILMDRQNSYTLLRFDDEIKVRFTLHNLTRVFYMIATGPETKCDARKAITSFWEFSVTMVMVSPW